MDLVCPTRFEVPVLESDSVPRHYSQSMLPSQLTPFLRRELASGLVKINGVDIYWYGFLTTESASSVGPELDLIGTNVIDRQTCDQILPPCSINFKQFKTPWAFFGQPDTVAFVGTAFMKGHNIGHNIGLQIAMDIIQRVADEQTSAAVEHEVTATPMTNEATLEQITETLKMAMDIIQQVGHEVTATPMTNEATPEQQQKEITETLVTSLPALKGQETTRNERLIHWIKANLGENCIMVRSALSQDLEDRKKILVFTTVRRLTEEIFLGLMYVPIRKLTT